MKNGDMPANPLPHQNIDANAEFFKLGSSGFTKREKMAIEFTKANIIGVCSMVENNEVHNWSFDDFAKEGLGQADALLNLWRSHD
jgi:hypothetical protein